MVEAASFVAVFLTTIGYLRLVLDLESSEWFTFAGCLFGCMVALAIVRGSRLQKQIDPVLSHLHHAGAGAETKSSIANSKQAFGVIMALPASLQRRQLVSSVASIPIVVALLWAIGSDSWIDGARIRSFAVITLVAAAVFSILLYHGARFLFTTVRQDLADAVSETNERARLVSPVSIRQKLLLAILVPALASILLVVDVVQVNLRSVATAEASRWAAVAVESVADADASLPLTDRIAARLPSPYLWPSQVHLTELSSVSDTRASSAGFSKNFLDALDRAVVAGGSKGRILSDGEEVIGAFRRLDDGHILVSRVARSAFDERLSAVQSTLILVVLGLIATALVIWSFVASEIRTGLAALMAESDRMAAGDFSVANRFESEDELGILGRDLETLGNTCRSSVIRLSTMADRVEQTATQISEIVANVAAASSGQFQTIQQASQLMVSINTRVGDASRSADILGSTIDESKNSVHQLGAAGDELNQTASVLTSKVDAVSSSLEQMVRSVKQVASTTEQLAAVSDETSSSMEEMASAMRRVDTSAETAANLSRDVVEKAELGRTKVVQTIAGMEAIRDATDAAETVIRGLGARTHEIGGILDVIDDVADETSLLALNAAIIAAQAGEHGKAFSVVADEIKELADRVLTSTKEISSLIRAVQEESENAIGAIEAGTASVMSGVDLSAEAGRTLEEITVASRESGDRITEIVASVREQTAAASHVVALMERLQESADQISVAGTEQDKGNEIVYRSALTMREVAQQVRSTTEDQSRGFGRIRQNVDGVQEAVEQIAGALREQSAACGEVTLFLEQVFEGTRSNDGAAGKMQEAMQDLVLQAQKLREDAERFRV
jgi:methyl-accepting chemotaxis protein